MGLLKTHSGLELVPRCEPSTYQPVSRWHNHCAIGVGVPPAPVHLQLWTSGIPTDESPSRRLEIVSRRPYIGFVDLLHVLSRLIDIRERLMWWSSRLELGFLEISFWVYGSTAGYWPSSSYMERKGNVLFNDALNTFYLRWYGVGTYGKVLLRQ